VKNANPVCRVWLSLVACLVVGLAAGCHRSDASAAPKSLADKFDITVGGRVVHLQLAVAMPEMERGLMERRDLGPDEGMLFIYERPQRMSFWMRNTPTPLDIGFFDSSGMLEEIYAMQPFDETGVQSRSTLLCLALEMNQGWFHEHGVKAGAQIDVTAVRGALKARGFDPTRYAIGR
jgi:uncharacterized membrane protein (UPF0127 family)